MTDRALGSSPGVSSAKKRRLNALQQRHGSKQQSQTSPKHRELSSVNLNVSMLPDHCEGLTDLRRHIGWMHLIRLLLPFLPQMAIKAQAVLLRSRG